MKPQYSVPLALLAGVGIAAVAVQTLHAQATPPIYYIAEVEVTNLEAYTKEYAPKAQAIIRAAGDKVLAAGQKVTPLEGAPPAPRVAVLQWESMDKLMAWRNSKEFKEAREIGVKYAKFRNFAIEGLPPQ